MPNILIFRNKAVPTSLSPTVPAALLLVLAIKKINVVQVWPIRRYLLIDAQNNG